jgi:hypothetical protein
MNVFKNHVMTQLYAKILQETSYVRVQRVWWVILLLVVAEILVNVSPIMIALTQLYVKTLIVEIHVNLQTFVVSTQCVVLLAIMLFADVLKELKAMQKFVVITSNVLKTVNVNRKSLVQNQSV